MIDSFEAGANLGLAVLGFITVIGLAIIIALLVMVVIAFIADLLGL